MVFLGVLAALTGILISSPASILQAEDSHCLVQEIAAPYAFDFVSWELHALSSLPEEIFHKDRDDSREAILRHQIVTVLSDKGISTFPPVAFKFEEPPHLLVVSPREKIAYWDRALLRQELSVEEMEEIESQVNALGLSSLVVELGGFGATYPAIVSDDIFSMSYTINVAVEEWLHQYLAFKPLGFLYLLDSIGVKQSPEVIDLNETLAGMVSREIGSEVYARYYQEQKAGEAERHAPDFDFNAEMSKTRKMVDQYLSLGKIEEAERYMEERRAEFAVQGYYIRKLNQAYFAFHGIYGQDPASVSPIYDDLEQLRKMSPSLKDFLNEVASMSSYYDLLETLGE